jgi:hypothetical protein
MKPATAKIEILDIIYAANNNEYYTEDIDIYFQGILMIIKLKNNYDDKKIRIILDTIFSTGYFISQYIVSTENIKNNVLKSESDFLNTLKKKKIINFIFKCEPKWDYQIKKLPKKIYHVTLHKYTNDILNNGLLPSSGKKKGYHPERNYFCKNYKDVSTMLLSLMKTDFLNKKINDKEERLYDILEINTNNLKSIGFDGVEYNIVFYKDENSSGIYTYDLIKPSNIKLIDSEISSYLN